MLPIFGGYAQTCYKSQGKTYTNAILDLNNITAGASPYVMISRLTSKEGLRILGEFKLSNLNIQLDEKQRTNIEQLESIGLDYFNT